MITICFTYFKSLTLANLAAALYSVSRQEYSRVREVVFIDNNSDDSYEDVLHAVEQFRFPVPVIFRSFKHGDRLKTHAWSTNKAVSEARSSWVLFTRADYLLDFDLVKKFVECIERTPDWNGFVTSNGCHLGVDIDACEKTDWRRTGPQFAGAVFDYTTIDTGVYLMRKSALDKVGGLDESLTAWGHAQTHFQHKLHASGVEFVRIPETLFYHPAHGGEKDINLAHAQLAATGVDLKECWTRYHGVSPYASL